MLVCLVSIKLFLQSRIELAGEYECLEPYSIPARDVNTPATVTGGTVSASVTSL